MITPKLTIPPATQDFADKNKQLRISLGIQAALTRSFKKYPMRRMTQAEVKRRFTLCFEGYRVMRNEQGWSSARCIDSLDHILDAALSGTPHPSSKRASWYGRA